MNTNQQSANGVTTATENNRSQKRNGWIIGSVGLAAIAVGSFFLFGLKQDESQLYGKYKAYSSDPAVNVYLAQEDTYFMINKDQTIVYNSTINGKPKFRFKGSYTLDERTKALSIQWEAGKAPSTLKIERENHSFIIKVGNTSYRK